MRKQITIESIGANVKSSKRRDQGTIAFKLSFDHRKPEISQRVANELVTLFLDENVKSRTERATETTEFLTQEAEKLKSELEKVETQLAAYKQEHNKALPQHQQLHMEMLSRTETELKDVEREYKMAQEELRFLDLELSAAKAGITPKTGAAYAPQSPQDIGSLKAEYQRLLSLYTEAHPDVRAVKRKIEALEATTSAAGAAKPTEAPVSLEVAKVQTKIAATNSRIESLAGQIKVLRGRMAGYEQQLLKIPQVERGLITLMRDHESAQKKYAEIHAKQMNAKIAENLEGENKAERFSLLEPPAFPDRPSKPDRVKILLMGVFAAFGGSGGLALFLETINQRIRGQEALAIAIRQRPMLAIPYIVIEDEVLGRKRMLKRLAVVVAAVIVISAILLHFLYMPLDILMMKIIARFG
jgi:succinoglycan biosynthesis transport protein ExoP